MNTNEKRRIALVVDDKVLVTKAVARVLGRRFETVLTANTPQEAELHLSTHHVTHLLCDFILGEGKVLALENRKTIEIAETVITIIIVRLVINGENISYYRRINAL